MKIAVLTSGGIDSSVALSLLKKEGYEVHAFYLKIWLEDETAHLGFCPWKEDLEYVREICDKLQVPLNVLSLQKEYYERVVSYALNEIKEGRTPNSDLYCNSEIKFGIFYDRIDSSYDAVASGHYASKTIFENREYLSIAKDTFKDQTYFLGNLSQNQLNRALFPLGDLTKKEVRELAIAFDLPNKDRKDSQGICFLGNIKYSDFVKHYFGEMRGDFIDYESKKKIGEHNGFWFFTVGQRKGIKLGNGPYYVVKKDMKRNAVYVSNRYHELPARNTFAFSMPHWISGKPPREWLKNLKIKVRHGEKYYRIREIDFEERGGRVLLDSSDQGFAEGQFAVFYYDRFCLGAAKING